jgi:hypothetical protein
VNAEVACQLAQGALERSPANMAVAVTGVLGPEPDEDGNPPGRVWFAAVRTGREPRLSKSILTMATLMRFGVRPFFVRSGYCARAQALKPFAESPIGTLPAPLGARLGFPVIMMCPGPLSDRALRWLIAYGKPRYDASAKIKSQR